VAGAHRVALTSNLLRHTADRLRAGPAQEFAPIEAPVAVLVVEIEHLLVDVYPTPSAPSTSRTRIVISSNAVMVPCVLSDSATGSGMR
jgi:hypothetical protein